MSFSSEVKKELAKSFPENPCCASALLAGLICFGGKFTISDYCTIKAENYKLLDFLSNFCAERYLICPTVTKRGDGFFLTLPDAFMLFQELDILKAGEIKFSIPDSLDACCKRAFIKGAFLGGGTVSSPEKQYHLEFATPHFGLSEKFAALLAEFDIPAKTLKRKSRFITYFKDNDIICDVLALMGASKAAIKVSETNITKSLSNLYNRRDNCESANYDKTMNASIKQIIAIEKIDRLMGLDNLPDGVREFAYLRLENRNLALAELARLSDPPISKSGANHRMRKLMQIADNLTGDNINE